CTCPLCFLTYLRLPPVFANGSKYPPKFFLKFRYECYCSSPQNSRTAASPLCYCSSDQFLGCHLLIRPPQHVVLYHPHISAATNRRLDRRKKQEIGRFLPKISIARSGDSEHHFLRSRYDFSTSRAVLAASCVG
ncbi:unnamed protein product, partial [Prunus brigantina]